jgi:hypothetical protein
MVAGVACLMDTYKPVIDKFVDYKAFCLQITAKRKIKTFMQWDK